MEDCRVRGRSRRRSRGVADAPESARRGRRRAARRSHHPHHQRTRPRDRSGAVAGRADPRLQCRAARPDAHPAAAACERPHQEPDGGRTRRRRALAAVVGRRHADRLPGRQRAAGGGNVGQQLEALRRAVGRRRAAGGVRVHVPFSRVRSGVVSEPEGCRVLGRQRHLRGGGGRERNATPPGAGERSALTPVVAGRALARVRGGWRSVHLRRTEFRQRLEQPARRPPGRKHGDDCGHRRERAGHQSAMAARQPHAAVHRQPPWSPRHLPAAGQPEGHQYRRGATTFQLRHQRAHDVALGGRPAAGLLGLHTGHEHLVDPDPGLGRGIGGRRDTADVRQREDREGRRLARRPMARLRLGSRRPGRRLDDAGRGWTGRHG